MLRLLLLLSLTLLLSFSAAAQSLPPLETQQIGELALNLPVGWVIEKSPNTISIKENPLDPESPEIIVAYSTLDAGVTPQMIAQSMLQSMTNVTIITEQKIGADGVYLILNGLAQGQPTRLALAAWSDTSINRLWFTMFATPPGRFETLGGAAMLPSVMNQGGAIQASPSRGSRANVQGAAAYDSMLDYDKALWIFGQQNPPSLDEVAGYWQQGISLPSGKEWRDLSSGQIRQGSSGYGMALILKPNGSYLHYYNFQSDQGGCNSKVQAAEEGDYQINGQTLTLSPRSFDGDLCLCDCKEPTKINENKPPKRSMKVALHPQRRALAVIMPCTPYMISCGQNGSLTALFEE